MGDFNSLNKNLINEEFIGRVIKERESREAIEIVKDTVPVYAAKYHTLYFEQHGDQSSTHSMKLPVRSDIYGKNYLVSSILETAESRILEAEDNISFPDSYMTIPNYRLVKESSIFIDFERDKAITYRELVDMIFDLFTNGEDRNILLNDFSTEKKYIGLANGVFEDENEKITFTCTFVLAKKHST